MKQQQIKLSCMILIRTWAVFPETCRNPFHSNRFCQFRPVRLWHYQRTSAFRPIWFHSQNLNDMLGVWDKAALPWNCSAVASSVGIRGKWLSLHHNLDRSSYSALSFGHWCTRGPLCASISPPCHSAITAHRAQWQKIIKWNVKSKGGQRMVFTTGLRVVSEMEKWIYCCYSLYWVDMLQIESMKYGMS